MRDLESAPGAPLLAHHTSPEAYREVTAVASSGRIIRATTTLSRHSDSKGQLLGNHVVTAASDEEGARSVAVLSWVAVAMLMICDVVGLGILSLAKTTAELGWALGLPCLLLFAPLSAYTGWLLWKAREVFPAAISMPAMALITHGRWLKITIDVILDATLFFIIAIYCLFLANTLQWLFYDQGLCNAWWSLIAVCVLALPVQLSRLEESKWIVFINSGSIVAALFIILGVIISRGRKGSSEAISSELDVWTFFDAFSTMAFAYGGQIIYLEFLAVMKNTKDFQKSIALSICFEVIVYTLVAVIGYYYLGSDVSSELVTAMPCNGWLRAASCFLIVHLIISVVVKQIILAGRLLMHAKQLFGSTNTDIAACDHSSIRFRLQWFAISSLTLTGYYIVINVIPFFGDLVSLVGAIGVGSTAFVFPPLFYYAAMNHLATIEVRQPLNGIDFDNSSRRTGIGRISAAHKIILVATFIFGIVIVVGGATSSVHFIIKHISSNPSPFSCSSAHSQPWSEIGPACSANV